MNIEKEYRFSVTDEHFKKIKKLSRLKTKSDRVTDIVMGFYGFNSLDKLGYICRIRQKNGSAILECKKRLNSNTWKEEQIVVASAMQAFSFLSMLGLKPYLLLDRIREERETDDFILALDEVSMLGKFVEVEFKDVNNTNNIKNLQIFLKSCGITSEPQKLYGDIFKEKIENDKNFKFEFEENLTCILKSL